MSKSKQPIQPPGVLAGNMAYPPNQAAAVSGRSRSRIFKAIRDGELTAVKDGRATLIMRDELQRWLGAMPTVGRSPAREVRNAQSG
jgi:excisionase family DNA binding protein